MKNIIIGTCLFLIANTMKIKENQYCMLNMHNEVRKENRLPLFKNNEQLTKIAQNHAKWMAKNDCVTHQNLKPLLRKPWKMIGENIAAYYVNDHDCFQGWMNSIGHRSNILNKKFHHVGFGKITYKNKNYWCVVFGAK